MNSSEFATIRAAHTAGEITDVIVGGRLIQYEPNFTFGEAMTLAPEGLIPRGFVMGPKAFVSEAEAARTVLHELHRLHTSSVVATGSADAASAARTTRDAKAFADAAWQATLAGTP